MLEPGQPSCMYHREEDQEVALKHGAGVEQETTEGAQAYAKYAENVDTPYRDGWLRSGA